MAINWEENTVGVRRALDFAEEFNLNVHRYPPSNIVEQIMRAFWNPSPLERLIQGDINRYNLSEGMKIMRQVNQPEEEYEPVRSIPYSPFGLNKDSSLKERVKIAAAQIIKRASFDPVTGEFIPGMVNPAKTIAEALTPQQIADLARKGIGYSDMYMSAHDANIAAAKALVAFRATQLVPKLKAIASNIYVAPLLAAAAGYVTAPPIDAVIGRGLTSSVINLQENMQALRDPEDPAITTLNIDQEWLDSLLEDAGVTQQHLENSGWLAADGDDYHLYPEGQRLLFEDRMPEDIFPTMSDFSINRINQEAGNPYTAHEPVNLNALSSVFGIGGGPFSTNPSVDLLQYYDDWKWHTPFTVWAYDNIRNRAASGADAPVFEPGYLDPKPHDPNIPENSNMHGLEDIY